MAVQPWSRESGRLVLGARRYCRHAVALTKQVGANPHWAGLAPRHKRALPASQTKSVRASPGALTERREAASTKPVPTPSTEDCCSRRKPAARSTSADTCSASDEHPDRHSDFPAMRRKRATPDDRFRVISRWGAHERIGDVWITRPADMGRVLRRDRDHRLGTFAVIALATIDRHEPAGDRRRVDRIRPRASSGRRQVGVTERRAWSTLRRRALVATAAPTQREEERRRFGRPLARPGSRPATESTAPRTCRRVLGPRRHPPLRL